MDKVRLPLPSKELVKTGVHCATGCVILALCSNTKAPFAGPLVAIIVSVGPLMAMRVIVGLGTTVAVMSRTWKRLTWGLGADPVEKAFRIKVCPPELFATKVPTMYCPGPVPSDPKLKGAEVLAPPLDQPVGDALAPRGGPVHRRRPAGSTRAGSSRQNTGPAPRPNRPG